MVRPVLVLLNGIPASGKSTVARAWAARHGADLPLALDIDVLRSMLGGWQDAPGEAGLAARAVAVAGIRTHLAAGRDVVVPQYLRRTAFIEELAAVALSLGAGFVECAILVAADEAMARFDSRRVSAQTGSGAHSPVLHGALGATSMDDVVADFQSMVDRPSCIPLVGSLDDVLDQLDAAVATTRS